MIRLNQLLKEETFTATNKSTGKTSVFKSKDSRDAAIKAGTHDAIKDKEQPSAPKAAGNSMFGGDYAKDRGGEAPKAEPKSDMGVDSVVYNKRTKTVGIVRMADERGETKTDADGNVNTDELEPYNPMKYPHQKDAQVAPSTTKEIDTRGLWKPFSSSSNNLKTKDGDDLKTAIGDSITKRSKNADFDKSGPYTILVRTGQYNDKIVANSKRIDNIDDLTQSYDKMRNKYDRKGTTFIEDGWGRTVFSESVVKESSSKLTNLLKEGLGPDNAMVAAITDALKKELGVDNVKVKKYSQGRARQGYDFYPDGTKGGLYIDEAYDGTWNIYTTKANGFPNHNHWEISTFPNDIEDKQTALKAALAVIKKFKKDLQ